MFCQARMLRIGLTTLLQAVPYNWRMNEIIPIRQMKQAHRPHFIEEWAEHRGYKNQAALAKALDIDKSLVSRWYRGATPGLEKQEILAALFHCERESLFRHPDEDWIARFFRNRSKDEIDRIKQTLELTFPRKVG